AEAAGVADLRVLLLPRRHPAADGLADASRSVDEAFLLEHVEHGERRRLCDRVADVRPADRVLAGRVHDLGLPEYTGEREPCRDRLRDGDQVGLDLEVLDPEHPAGATEARLHFVDDHHDVLPVADLTHALDELARRDDEAAFALYG